MGQIKQRDYRLTVELLGAYTRAALSNARALATEAKLLLDHKHHARSYFLAVASIEETGKAVMAHEGGGRNLKDSAVEHRMKLSLEDHGQKIMAAFFPTLADTSTVRERLMPAVQLMLDLSHGREPSMYSDIVAGGGKVQIPNDVIPHISAADCVRLSEVLIARAAAYVSKPPPQRIGSSQDAYFAMKSKEYAKIFQSPAFWDFYLERLEAGDIEFNEAILAYAKRCVAE